MFFKLFWDFSAPLQTLVGLNLLVILLYSVYELLTSMCELIISLSSTLFCVFSYSSKEVTGVVIIYYAYFSLGNCASSITLPLASLNLFNKR